MNTPVASRVLSRPVRTRLHSVVSTLAVCLLSACVSTQSEVASASKASPWLKPTPTLRQRIADEAARLPWTHGIDRVDLIQWFAKVGEPAYPTLLDMVLDPRADVAGAALAALGATRDSRLVEPLRALPWPTDGDGGDVALERARTLLRLGDWQMVPRLIAGLSDERLMTRALCAQALEEATKERFGFDPRAEADERAVAVAKWEEWWKSRSADPLLSPPIATPKAPSTDAQ